MLGGGRGLGPPTGSEKTDAITPPSPVVLVTAGMGQAPIVQSQWSIVTRPRCHQDDGLSGERAIPFARPLRWVPLGFRAVLSV